MGLLDYLREQLNPPNSLLDRKYVDKYQEWQPEAKRVGGQALEAPMFAPDDLIGTGIPSKLVTLLAPALKTAAIGAAPLATMGLLSKAAEQKGVTTVANKLAQALDGQAGAIAWHGSPHKFDKFDLAKIGTGEGAQAYGHGLYLAESPEVGKEYARVLTKNAAFDGKPVYEIDTTSMGRRNTGVRGTVVSGRDAKGGIPVSYAPSGLQDDYSGPIEAIKDLISAGKVPKNATKWIDPDTGHINISSVEPQLYKTDIPDEAVARFLDWDKPLSQQAPDVQAALEKSKNKQLRAMLDYAKVPYSEMADGEAKTMGEAFRLLNLNLHGKSSADSAKASALLAKQGIPGIRYLDGGSRGTGQGTSNFVVFDPDMIRILERNGQATGAQPWQPGEWGGLLK